MGSNDQLEVVIVEELSDGDYSVLWDIAPSGAAISDIFADGIRPDERAHGEVFLVCEDGALKTGDHLG
jgi:hypothetical protein